MKRQDQVTRSSGSLPQRMPDFIMSRWINTHPSDRRRMTRAAWDYDGGNLEFTVGAGLLAIYYLDQRLKVSVTPM